ncbi:hypothetical protein HDU80_003289, partial [Chytriomyces hyalinus]
MQDKIKNNYKRLLDFGDLDLNGLKNGKPSFISTPMSEAGSKLEDIGDQPLELNVNVLGQPTDESQEMQNKIKNNYKRLSEFGDLDLNGLKNEKPSFISVPVSEV